MIFWVFGGTAVGKKRFIERCVNPATRPGYLELPGELRGDWINDGPAKFDIVDAAKRGSLMLRWQWGREETLDSICKHHPGLRHAVVLLSTDLMTQLSRVALREGCLKWNAENVHGEQRQIYELVHRIGAEHKVPVFYVDSSNDDYGLRGKVA